MSLDSVSGNTLDLGNLSYLTEVDDNLCCPICHSPLIDPVHTKCRHTFCSSCITEALETSKTCPVDRKPLKLEDVSAAPIMIANLVNDLVVLCPNSGFGCPMTCARHLLAGHLREDCAFAAVKCLGCDGTIMRKDAGSGCLHQLVECPFCSFSCRKLDMEGHEAECPRIIAVCSHCSQDFAHPNIKAHEATCGEAIILCDSSDVGCPWKGARRELSEHMRVCAFTPLRPVLHAYADRLATLELENKALRRRLDILIPPRPPTEVPTPSFDEHTIQLLAEQEHLRSDLERLTASLGEMEIRREMLLVNESLGMKEEVAGLRAAIGGIRMQIHWLMNTRHQAVDQRPVGGASSSNGPQNSSSQGGGGALPNITRMADPSNDRVKL